MPEPFARIIADARAAGLASLPTPARLPGPRPSPARSRHLARTGPGTGSAASRTQVSSGSSPGRRTVLDVCPISNLRTGVVASLEAHPVPQLISSGEPRSLSTDDPAMLDTDLAREYEAAVDRLDLDARAFSEAAVEGALCDEATHIWLREIGATHEW